MNFGKIFDVVSRALPVIGEFIGFIAKLPDKEWEEISKAWPAPTKTKMAMVRAEAKAVLHFFGEAPSDVEENPYE